MGFLTILVRKIVIPWVLKKDSFFFKGYKINRKSEQKLFIIVFIGMDLKIVYHVLKLTTKKVVGNDNESIYLEPAVFGHVKRDE